MSRHSKGKFVGRRAQPAAVKEAKGNPGRRRIVREGKAAPRTSLSAPSTLNAAQKRLWSKLSERLGDLRILRETDLPAFGRYVALLAKWEEVDKALRAAQLVQVTDSEHVTGLERVGKWLMVALMLDKRLTEIEDRFGMNPAARQRLFLQMAAAGSAPRLPLDSPAPAKTADAVPPLASPPLAEMEPIGLLQ